MRSQLTAIDPTHAATVKLRFSGINRSRTKSDAKLKSMVDGAVAKSEAKPMIVEKLEKVRGLAKMIEGIGEIVGEVSGRPFLALDSGLIIGIASSSGQGRMESNGTSY